MKKDKKNALLFLVIMFFVIILSYFIYVMDVPSKVKLNLENIKASVSKNIDVKDRPVITNIINSSGGNMVNTDVALIVNATSRYNIEKIEYSYDLKNWKKVNKKLGKKEETIKLVYTKTMDKKVYLRVVNDHGYKSYAYEVVIKIDKEKPKIGIATNNEDVLISVSDNVGLKSIQYSNDMLNWDDEIINGQDIVLRKFNFNYKYVRVVDETGNISEIKSVK